MKLRNFLKHATKRERVQLASVCNNSVAYLYQIAGQHRHASPQMATRIEQVSRQVAAQSEMSDCVQGFIGRLPATYRTVLVLHDLQGLKNREIAEVLDCSLDTVKIRLHRARKKLRASLNVGCDFAHDERNVFVCEPKAEREEAGE